MSNLAFVDMCFLFPKKERQHINRFAPHPFPGQSKKVVDVYLFNLFLTNSWGFWGFSSLFQKRPDVHKIVLSITMRSPPPPEKSVNLRIFYWFVQFFPIWGGGETKLCGQEFNGRPDFSVFSQQPRCKILGPSAKCVENVALAEEIKRFALTSSRDNPEKLFMFIGFYGGELKERRKRHAEKQSSPNHENGQQKSLN